MNKYTLILSGGGTRAFYTIGVLQALQEAGLREHICAVYGVSAGAIIGTLWLAGYEPQWMYTTFASFLTSNSFAIKPSLSQGLVDTSRIERFLSSYIPHTFDELPCKMHIGASDLLRGQYVGFTSGEILPPIMASMAVPGVFAPVAYDNMYLVDGGIIDAYPIEEAIADFPDCCTIGVMLLYKQTIDIPGETVFWVLNRSFDVARQASMIHSAKHTDILCCYDCSFGLLDLSPRNRERSYHQGYRDGLIQFNTVSV